MPGFPVLNTVKMSVLLKVICRLNVFPIKIPMTFFTEVEKSNPKINMEPQEATSSPSNLKQMFKKLDALYYLLSMCTTKLQLLNQHDPGEKNRHIDQRKRVRNPNINPHIYGQLIFDKSTKNTH